MKFLSYAYDSKSRRGGRLFAGACFAALLITAAAPAAQAAEGGLEPECYQGEYVISLTNIPVLRQKAVEALESVSPQDFEISAQTSQTVLISESDLPPVRDEADKRIVPYRRRLDLCDKLKQKRREQLRQRSRRQIIRQYRCDCNAVLYPVLVPDDPYLGVQWALHQANGIDINMPEAWDLTRGDFNTVVAVIDTGVNYNHGDLNENMWRNPGEVAGNGVDDDQNGYVDDIYGANMITASGDPLDDHGHGTHVAGTIGARTNNGYGMAGINWQIQIMAVKFLSSSGSGSLFNAVKAIDYVTMMKQHGINLVLSNNSWGGGGYYTALYDAIGRARQAGLLFVAAAGNSHVNADVTPMYPAAYDLDNIISVAAIDSNGNLASFSNYGQTSVDIAAPGVSIASTYIGSNPFVYMSGTSMAAPHVSGALALLASDAPQYGWAALRDNLFASGTALSSLSGMVATGKMINVFQMLSSARANPTPPASPTASPTPSPTPTPVPTLMPTPYPTATPTPTPTPTATPKPGPYSVRGLVMMGYGISQKGLPGALVRLATLSGEWSRSTGPSGEYSFDGVVAAPTNYTITVQYDGYNYAPQSGRIAGDLNVNFYATIRYYILSGTVMTRSKQVLGGITIDAGSLGSVTTDSQGRFSFMSPYGSSYALHASAEGYAFDSAELQGIIWGDVERVFVAFPQ